MRAIKIAFFIFLAIWLGGALLTWEYGTAAKQLEMLAGGMSDQDVTMMNLRGISIRLFAPLSVITGLVLLGMWIARRSTGKASEPSAEGMVAKPPQPDEPVNMMQPINPPASMPPKNEHPTNSAQLSCNFTGWARDGNRIVQEYTYRGQGWTIGLRLSSP